MTGGSVLPGSSVGIGILSDRSFDSLKDSISEPTMKVCFFDLLYIHHSFCTFNMVHLVQWLGKLFRHINLKTDVSNSLSFLFYYIKREGRLFFRLLVQKNYENVYFEIFFWFLALKYSFGFPPFKYSMVLKGVITASSKNLFSKKV